MTSPKHIRIRGTGELVQNELDRPSSHVFNATTKKTKVRDQLKPFEMAALRVRAKREAARNAMLTDSEGLPDHDRASAPPTSLDRGKQGSIEDMTEMFIWGNFLSREATQSLEPAKKTSQTTFSNSSNQKTRSKNKEKHRRKQRVKEHKNTEGEGASSEVCNEHPHKCLDETVITSNTQVAQNYDHYPTYIATPPVFAGCPFRSRQSCRNSAAWNRKNQFAFEHYVCIYMYI
jgi:hypothetical protein